MMVTRPAGTPKQAVVPQCPLTSALEAIGGKWKMIILWWLDQEPKHFAELRRQMPGVSPKVLSQQLRELQQAGLVRREVQNDALRHVVYSLTDHGQSLHPILEAVRQWGHKHINHSRATPSRSGPRDD